jgi:hypothetical protein
LLSQARKKWSERIRAPGETALAGERLGLLLDAVAESLPLRPGSRHALQIQIVSRLAHLAEQIVAARAAGQQVFVRRSLTQAEWSMAQQAGGRPGLTEVSLALQGQRPQSPNGADKPPGRSLDHALLPLLMLQSLAPQYGKKRGITSAVHQVMMKRF